MPEVSALRNIIDQAALIIGCYTLMEPGEFGGDAFFDGGGLEGFGEDVPGVGFYFEMSLGVGGDLT